MRNQESLYGSVIMSGTILMAPLFIMMQFFFQTFVSNLDPYFSARFDRLPKFVMLE